MRLFVRSACSGTLSVDANASDTVCALKGKIGVLCGYDASEQQLSYGGLPLTDDMCLCDSDITEFDCLDLNCDLLGGAKKRKKKVYTTPKKIKHKKKKVKLATLKFYKVDSNGKITRLRRECPNEKCGAGVFMASHFDRQYCGKCALTYMHAGK
ncbi:unnamed protein product [Calicophoron daubneyi]|uniref:Ubiquitin-like domain-containing protein n=1 Tax=Calicophoron daubneyi TaxID=300641 RepID=A0AAV2SWI7_CALDB